MARTTEELVAAYVDGVAELTADERKRVEELLAADSSARADADAMRALLGQLRELPAEGSEPDWGALERSIRGAVGTAAPRPWWKRWQWLAPIGAVAATAAGALLWLHEPRGTTTIEEPAPIVHVDHRAQVETAPLVWLDGDAFDLDQVDPTALDDHPAADPIAAGDGSSDGILTESDLDWVDQLDDSALERAETWRASHGERKKG